MNSQLKKGMLEYCVLATLRTSDSYGYQIIKDTSGVIDLSDSTLYPILKRLEKQETIESYSVEHNGRLRKYYHLTETGLADIQGFLNDWQQVMTVYDYIKGAN